MFNINNFVRGLLFIFIAAISANGQSGNQDRIEDLFTLVRGVYSGDSAYNTVAYVEKFWRIAGNDGFNKSIHKVEQILLDAGYVEESNANDNSLMTYRIERRPMRRLTWEPEDAMVNIDGDEEPLLTYTTNRNMIAVNSWSTDSTIKGEIVYIPKPVSENIDKIDIKGKIVFAEASLRTVQGKAIEKGAIGVFVYDMPGYLKPEENVHSIQFKRIRQDDKAKPWAVILSNQARSRLLKKIETNGIVIASVSIDTRFYESEELTLVAEVKGHKYPEQRFVFSAHVQEPGANDNASGVGAQAEMARALAELVHRKEYAPDRTITFLFGDEIISTRRFIKDDAVRAKNIKWGMSLDMVGEDTDKTGGTFLIEKMPDPGAVWLRGDDQHTEWGGRPLDPKEIIPHYYNDLVLDIFQRQGKYSNWVVNSNPFEGGSDHTPFLRANIPGLLLWHFTDAFYHTDGDRIDKVSAASLQNVGTGALVTSMYLANADAETANQVLELTNRAASQRLDKEFQYSGNQLKDGGDLQHEVDVLTMWINYYQNVFESVKDMVPSNELDTIGTQIERNKTNFMEKGQELINELNY